jgi:hypothetical protein
MLIDAMDQHPYTTSGDPLQQKVSLYAKWFHWILSEFTSCSEPLLVKK